MSTADQKTQVRGGTGLFTGKPPYVWISNQIGNTGVLSGFVQRFGQHARRFPFNPNPDKYKPAATGAAAGQLRVDVTDQSFKFPQTWRSNIGVDRRCLGHGRTADYIYNRDVNGMVYINANLPAAQSVLHAGACDGACRAGTCEPHQQRARQPGHRRPS